MMAAGFPLLSTLIFLPLAGVVILALLRGEGAAHEQLLRRVALSTSLAVLALSLVLWMRFDPSTSAYQFEDQAVWLPGTGITYHVGVDGISVLLVMLTTIMAPLCIIGAWNAIRVRARDLLIALLLLEGILIGVFSAMDLMLFYIFFEASMVPVFLIIGIWGGAGRAKAALKLFLYTMLGALFMLLAVMVLWQLAGSTDLADLLALSPSLTHHAQMWFFAAFALAFAIKLPLFPLHTWQPDAYAESPTAGSVMLGGVMLNMGSYGFLRFAIPLFPDAARTFSPLIFSLAAIAIVYASLIAMVQKDMKRTIAYSSVAHMGVVAIGLFSVNQHSISGAVMQMLSYGVISGALFLSIGMLEERMRSQEIDRFGGIAKVMPVFSALFMLFTMAAVALPGTVSFTGEFLVIVGAFKSSPWLSVAVSSAMILSVCYMLWLYRRVLFGAITRDEVRRMVDLSPREMAILAPLVVLTLWGGIYPSSFLDFFQASVSALVMRQEALLAATKLAGL